MKPHEAIWTSNIIVRNGDSLQKLQIYRIKNLSISSNNDWNLQLQN